VLRGVCGAICAWGVVRIEDELVEEILCNSDDGVEGEGAGKAD
jgi:hypothetical protein